MDTSRQISEQPNQVAKWNRLECWVDRFCSGQLPGIFTLGRFSFTEGLAVDTELYRGPGGYEE